MWQINTFENFLFKKWSVLLGYINIFLLLHNQEPLELQYFFLAIPNTNFYIFPILDTIPNTILISTLSEIDLTIPIFTYVEIVYNSEM